MGSPNESYENSLDAPDPMEDLTADEETPSTITPAEATSWLEQSRIKLNTPNVTPEEWVKMKKVLDSLLDAYPSPRDNPLGQGQAARFQDHIFHYKVTRFDNTSGRRPGSYGLTMHPHPLAFGPNSSHPEIKGYSINENGVYHLDMKDGSRESIQGERFRQGSLYPLPDGARKTFDFDEIFQRIQKARREATQGSDDSWNFEVGGVPKRTISYRIPNVSE